MFNVEKRDGAVVEFELAKITEAVRKAFEAMEKQYSTDMLEMISLRVTSDFQEKITDNKSEAKRS